MHTNDYICPVTAFWIIAVSGAFMKSLLITIIVLTLASCSTSDKDFQLNDTERALFSSFRKGDTLYYENENKDVDTFLILGIDSAQQMEAGYLMKSPAHNDIWVNMRQLPIDTFVHGIFYDSVKNKADTEYTQLFSIRKLPQENKVQYSFSFRRFFETREGSIGQIQTAPITMKGTVIKDYYLIKNTGDTTTNNIEALYWTQKDGLIAYKYRDGTIWTKKSSR
jgi:hypothetical protein